MSIRLIRQESETPNVSNHDDARMVRYAYGGYDGFVKDRGQEIGHAISGTAFVVQSGVINLQGWEVEIDANGVSIPTSASVTNKQYYSVYLEVNCATDTAEIKSLTDPAGYPEIPESDDLTQNTIGTARLLLYHFTATGGVIADIEKIVQGIEYAGEVAEKLREELKGLEDGTIKPADSLKVNGLEIKRDASGILKIGDTIISQKKLIWKNNGGAVREISNIDLLNKKIQIDYNGRSSYFTITESYNDTKAEYLDFCGADARQYESAMIPEIRSYCFRYWYPSSQKRLELGIKELSYDFDQNKWYNAWLIGGLNIERIYEIIE